VRVMAAGVSLPDLMAREGIHPETPAVPYTPGWDLVGGVHNGRFGRGAGVSCKCTLWAYLPKSARHMPSTGAAIILFCELVETVVTPAEQDPNLYRLLVENSLGLMCIHDMEGVLLTINPALFCETL
jgi:hypothetical protein